MSRRSTVFELPPEVRKELDQRLINAAFAGYDDLIKWLHERDFSISRAALGRYGYKLKAQFASFQETNEQIKALCEAYPDDEGQMLDAAQRIMVQKILDAVLDSRLDFAESLDAAEVSKLTRAMADLGRSSISLKRYQSEVRKQRDAAAARVKTIASNGGLSDDAIAAIELELGAIG